LTGERHAAGVWMKRSNPLPCFPVSKGGLALSRPLASAVLAHFIIGCLLLLPQRAGQHPGRSEVAS